MRITAQSSVTDSGFAIPSGPGRGGQSRTNAKHPSASVCPGTRSPSIYPRFPVRSGKDGPRPCVPCPSCPFCPKSAVHFVRPGNNTAPRDSERVTIPGSVTDSGYCVPVRPWTRWTWPDEWRKSVRVRLSRATDCPSAVRHLSRPSVRGSVSGCPSWTL